VLTHHIQGLHARAPKQDTGELPTLITWAAATSSLGTALVRASEACAADEVNADENMDDTHEARATDETGVVEDVDGRHVVDEATAGPGRETLRGSGRREGEPVQGAMEDVVRGLKSSADPVSEYSREACGK
jgi:hypothetical protein